MVSAIIFDFSRVLFFPKDLNYTGSLNEKHRELSGSNSYKLLDHFSLNLEVLDFLKSIQGKYELYIFTSETIQESQELVPYLEPLFKEVFSGLRLGISKADSQAYKLLSEKINKKPEEILFIDDSESNLKAAKSAGLQTIHFTSNKELFRVFKEYELLHARDIC